MPKQRKFTVAAGTVTIRHRPGKEPHVLLVHRPAYNDWTLPKGHLDPDEYEAVAAVRETHEESGVRVVLREPLVAFSSTDPAVQAVALGLVVWLLLYQCFDALQTVAAHALRGYKVTLLPMLVHTFCFWGIGLAGGYWLSFHAPWRTEAPTVAGFWEACVLATLAATLLFGALLRAVSRRHVREAAV